MKKRVIASVMMLALMLTLVFAAPTQSLAASTITVTANNTQLTAYKYTRSNVRMLPMRTLFQAIGGTYSYSGGKATITYGGNTYKITKGSTRYYKNGKYTRISPSPAIYKSSLYAPYTFLTDVVGLSVSFDSYGNATVTGSSSSSSGTTTTGSTISIVANGVTQAMNAYSVSGYVMVPFKLLASLYGYGYSKTSTAESATSAAKTITIYSGSTTYYIGTTPYVLPAAPVSIDGCLYLPTTIIGAAFGGGVSLSGNVLTITGTTSSTSTAASGTGSYTLYINGAYASAATSYNGIYMAPLTYVANALGYTISQTGYSLILTRTNAVTTTGYYSIKMTVGTNSYQVSSDGVNYSTVTQEQAPYYLVINNASTICIPVNTAELLMGGTVSGPTTAGVLNLYTTNTYGSTTTSTYKLYVDNTLTSGVYLLGGVYMVPLSAVASRLGYTTTVSGSVVTLARTSTYYQSGYTTIVFTIGTNSFLVNGATTLTDDAAPQYLYVDGASTLCIPANMTERMMGGYITNSGTNLYLTTYGSGTTATTGSTYGLYFNGTYVSTNATVYNGVYLLPVDEAAYYLGYSCTVSGSYAYLVKTSSSNYYGQSSLTLTTGTSVYSSSSLTAIYLTINGASRLYMPADLTEYYLGGYIYGPSSGSLYLTSK